MIIEGRNAVVEVILGDRVKTEKVMIDRVIRASEVSKILDTAREKGIRVEYCDRVVLDRMSETRRHQGWIAVTADYEYAQLEDILAVKEERGEPHFILLLDGISDPQNLGSILRVAECAGVHGVVIAERRCAPVNETVLRVAAGAAAHLKIARVKNLNDCIASIKARGVFVYGAELGGEPLYRTNLKGDLGLVIGSEGDGLHRLTRERCDAIVTLPMFGSVNSLNAACACGAVVYEAVRQRLS